MDENDKWTLILAGFVAGVLLSLAVYFYKEYKDREKALQYLKRVMEEKAIE